MTDKRDYDPYDFCGEICIFCGDIINRQKAEIERLKREAVIDANEIKCTRIHRDRARAEAIKEFVKRLKAKAETECFYEDDETYTRCVVDTDKIDKIANEMVGDSDDR